MNNTLTKSSLALLVAEHLGISKAQASELVNDFFAEVRDALARGENVKLTGFGSFRVRHKRARPGRNPRTGEPALVSARTVTVFRAGQKLLTSCVGPH